MLNLTLNPIFPNPENLMSALKKATECYIDNAVYGALYDYGSDVIDETSLRYRMALKRSTKVITEAPAELSDPLGFAHALFDVATKHPKDVPSETIELIYAPSGRPLPSAISLNHFRKFAKSVSYQLWSDRELLYPLPGTFSIQSSTISSFLDFPENLKFCISYGEDLDKSSLQFRLRYHVSRWLTITDWLRPEDIEIDEAAHLRQFFINNRHTAPEFGPSAYWNAVGPFLMAVARQYPDRVNYTESDVEIFEKAALFKISGTTLLSLSQQLEDKVNAPKKVRPKSAHRPKTKAQSRAEKARKFAALAEVSGTPEALAVSVVYETRFPKDGWFRDVSGIDFLDTDYRREIVENWSPLLDQFIEYRHVVKRYEQDKGTKATLHVIADYLTICIPTFRHFFGNDLAESKIIPDFPRNFKRYPFIDDLGSENVIQPTFSEYIAVRFPSPGSRYAHMSGAERFFDFISDTYRDDERIAGSDFSNPIRQYDRPLSRTLGRPNHSNKVPIKRTIYPHFRKWLFAMEAIVVFVDGLSDNPLPNNFDGDVVDAHSIGYVPFYIHDDTVYPVSMIPAEFVRNNDAAGLRPSTTLRLIITAVETGLRFQNIQWLCRDAFDKLNTDLTFSVQTLYVNTDKVRDSANAVPIFSDLRELLVRQASDFDRFNADQPKIYYEGREHTRFEMLRPLFFNSLKKLPLSDGAYNRMWTNLMSSFQVFYGTIAEYEKFIIVSKPKIVRVEATKCGDHYCPLRVATVSTPHAVRSSFITRRAGILPRHVISDLVLHRGPPATSHYVVPDKEELDEIFEHADNAVMSGSRPQPSIHGGPAYIHAEKVNSTLARAVLEDRQSAIAGHSMISLKVFDNENDEESGIDKLKSASADDIVFRSTHICPLNEKCPAEIVEELGGFFRCGGCRFACKSVDHLPAIGAKQRTLFEAIVRNQEAYKFQRASGAEKAELQRLYDTIDRDVFELTCWRASEEILVEMAAHGGVDAEAIFAFEPDLVRFQLQRVVRPSSQGEFVLRRIIDASHFPEFATDWLRSQAQVLLRRIMGARDEPVYRLGESNPDREIQELASLVTVCLKATGTDLARLADEIENPAFESGMLQKMLPSDWQALPSMARLAAR